MYNQALKWSHVITPPIYEILLCKLLLNVGTKILFITAYGTRLQTLILFFPAKHEKLYAIKPKQVLVEMQQFLVDS